MVITLKKSFPFLVAFLFTGCSIVRGGAGNSGDIGPIVFDGTPEAGLGGIVGKIENAHELWPNKNLFIFMAQFYGDQEGEGAFILEPSIFPKAQLGSEGGFQVMDLPPMSYVLILGPNAETGVTIMENGRTAVYTVNENAVLDLGSIFIDP